MRFVHGSQQSIGQKAILAIMLVAAYVFVAFGLSTPFLVSAYADEATSSEVTNPDMHASSLVQLSDIPYAESLERVEVSAEGAAALLQSSSYAVSDFSRAQVGSSRPVEGKASGYNYYLGTSSGWCTIVAYADDVVCYIPQSVQESFRIDLSDIQEVARLQAYFIALDNANAKGSSRLSTKDNWYFTTSPEVVFHDRLFSFDVELTSDRFYSYIAPSGGSLDLDDEDVALVKPEFADFCKLTPVEQVAITQNTTGIAAVAEFLQSIDYSPLWVTLKTTGVAIVIIFILGLAAAYFLLNVPKRAQDILDSIFTIPMVLPPTVCGFLLLLAFGRSTAVGQWFIEHGCPLVFSWQATVIAAVVVAFPLMYRSARGAFESIDITMLDAARTLGWSNARIFFRLMLPLSWSSIAAGTVLAFARALGEFGATLFMAGNYLGVTRTIPIAIYFEWMNGNTDVALFWTAVIMVFSFIVIMFINIWSRRTTRYRRRAQED